MKCEQIHTLGGRLTEAFHFCVQHIRTHIISAWNQNWALISTKSGSLFRNESHNHHIAVFFSSEAATTTAQPEKYEWVCDSTPQANIFPICPTIFGYELCVVRAPPFSIFFSMRPVKFMMWIQHMDLFSSCYSFLGRSAKCSDDYFNTRRKESNLY